MNAREVAKHKRSVRVARGEEFVKVFERKVQRVQAAYLHDAARALSSPSRRFQLRRQIFIS